MAQRVRHLIRRTWGSWMATAPTSSDEVWVEHWLTDGERCLWRRLCDADRAHALMVAKRFQTRLPQATRAEMAAALLHDCGKIDSDLGTPGRIAATLLGRRTRRWQSYHDHERLGGALLEAAGSDQVTIALVARHPEAPEAARRTLDEADEV